MPETRVLPLYFLHSKTHSMNYRFTVGSLSILSGILSLGCLVVGAIAVNNNFEAFSDPQLLLQYSNHSKAAYWFNILDMFGYYLLLMPLIFYVNQQYKFRTPWMNLFTSCGLFYVLIGAMGAVILAVTWPPLMNEFLHAEEDEAKMISFAFSAITRIVAGGLWNILEVIFAAVWFTGIGKLLYKENKAIGITGIVVGIASVFDAVGNILEIKVLSETGLNIYLLGSILFVFLFGIRLIRSSKQEHSSQHEKLQPIPEFGRS